MNTSKKSDNLGKLNGEWVKVAYKEDNVSPARLAQGTFYDYGSLIEIVGDFKTFILNKENLVSLHKTNKGETYDEQNKQRKI